MSLHSVYDFLYHDARRVGSFLAQLDPSGHLQSFKRSDRNDKGAGKKDAIDAEGGLPFLAKVKGAMENASTDLTSIGSEALYDPLWKNALTFLNLLSDSGLLHRNLEAATLGQIVLVSGQLTVLDLSMLKSAWNIPTVQQAARAGQPQAAQTGNRQHRRSSGDRPSSNKMPTEFDLMFDLIQTWPHTIHALMDAGDDRVWASLRDEYLVSSASELTLTHGAILPEEWHMVGVLSARPDFGNAELHQKIAEIHNGLDAGLINSAMGNIVLGLAPAIRVALGRPLSAYAITPLLVFRQLT